MGYNLKEIFECFDADGTFLTGETYGSGHIHDTFRIETVEKEKDDYILQRLNNKIFKNVPELEIKTTWKLDLPGRFIFLIVIDHSINQPVA